MRALKCVVMRAPVRVAVMALTATLASSYALAEECPDHVPEETAQRRVLAKKWFGIAESAAKEGDDLGSLRAYQCSSKFVQHGYTSYNIAQIAERIGDLELAVNSYGQYLILVPDAKDTQEVNERIDGLKQRLAEAREREKSAAAARQAQAARARENNRRAAATRVAVATSESGRDSDETPRYRNVGWITMGSGGALLIAGVITNVLARGKMDSCRDKYNQGDQPAADAACSDAKPLAYTSYATLGLGAAAVAAGTLLLFYPTGSGDGSVSLLPGGASLQWSGKF